MNGVTLTLVDLNHHMVNAWAHVFDGIHGVEVVHGSLLDEQVDAWVTPTNARAQMNGGVDAAVLGRLGRPIQARVRRAVQSHFGDFMPVGVATCVETGRATPRYLISAPTMSGVADNVSATLNVALACGAALQAVREQNRRVAGSIKSVAVPGMGAGTGQVPVAVCADLMWTAWNLFNAHDFDSFADMRAALEAELGDLGPAPVVAPTTPCRTRGPVLPVPFHGERRPVSA